MSKYTTELRYIIDNEALLTPGEGVLSLSGVLAEYPLSNEDRVNPLNSLKRREELNKVITEHFYFREIGFETVNRFLYNLRRKFDEIMPYYNQRFDSVDVEFNPLFNVDMTETFTHTVEGTGSAATTGTNTNTSNVDNLNVDSDTPNQTVTEADIKSNAYASSTSYNKGTNVNTLVADMGVDTTDSKTETYTRHNEGSSAGLPFSKAVDQWRGVMLNINMEIVSELETLFMNIY